MAADARRPWLWLVPMSAIQQSTVDPLWIRLFEAMAGHGPGNGVTRAA
jgi:hypothetical protein